MGGLGARRHRQPVTVLCPEHTVGAIPQGEHARIPGGPQAIVDGQGVAPTGFQTIEVAQKIRRLDARRPDFQPRRDDAAACGANPLGGHFRHLLAGQDLDPDVRQPLQRPLRNRLGQCRQDPIRRLQECDPHAGRRYLIEPVTGHGQGRIVDLGGQLDARGAGPDNADIQARVSR